MRLRVGPGPVFFLESMQAARRWQTYALRAAFVAALLTSLVVVWVTRTTGQVTISQLAAVGEAFFYAIVGTQLALVLLAAPAFTAGSICLDKARGNLAHMLTTDLSGAEVVLGKLFARLMPVAGLVITALPVLALTALLGGVDPEALLGACAVSLAAAAFGSTLALVLSVWGRKTHEVLIVVYVIYAILLLLQPVARWLPGGWGLTPLAVALDAVNPFLVAFGPYLRPGVTWNDYVPFLAGASGLSALFALAAVATLRPVAKREGGRPERRRAPKDGKPSPLPHGALLDLNPVLWREWHRRRPSRWMKGVVAVYAVLAVGAAVLAVVNAWGTGPGREMAAFVNAFTFSVGLALVSITSVTSLQEERARGSLDVLMTTPLPTRSIVWGKWWGAYRAVPLLMILPLLLGAVTAATRSPYGTGGYQLTALAVMAGLMLAYGAAVVSLGLGLATWVPRFGRAVGLSVAAYVLVTAGVVFFLLAVRMPGAGMRGVASASPWFGIGWLTASLSMSHEAEAIGWGLFWMLVYGIAAALLLAITLTSFDRCLGRVAENARPLVPDRPHVANRPRRKVRPVR